MGIQPDEHTRAMTLLLQTVLGQPVGPTDEEAAKLHVAHCEVCWPRFKQLAEVLMGEPAPLKDDSGVEPGAHQADDKVEVAPHLRGSVQNNLKPVKMEGERGQPPVRR